jgi:4-oxalocrotonate tautomerase
VIYTAMTGVLNVPNDDRFMVITEHDQADLVISPEHLGIGHTADVVLIQVTRNEGRTVPVKWDFYRAVADGLHERTGQRREDVIICLVEVKKETGHSATASPSMPRPGRDREIPAERHERRVPGRENGAAGLGRAVGRCGRPLAVPGREPAP